MQTRSKYIKQLEDLNSSIQRMSDKAAADIRAAGLALAGDAGAAEGIMQGAKAERHLRSAIEDGCLDAMLLQQPLVADDLRFVSGAFRLVSDLTHVGGMTREVAYLALSIPQETIAKIGDELSASAEKVANMIEQASAAFLNSVEEATTRRRRPSSSSSAPPTPTRRTCPSCSWSPSTSSAWATTPSASPAGRCSV